MDKTTVMSWLEGLSMPDWRLYHSDSEVQNIALSAIELLNEEPVEPRKDFDGHYVWRCGNCGAPMFHSYNGESVEDAKNYVKFCRLCGKGVKWE